MILIAVISLGASGRSERFSSTLLPRNLKSTKILASAQVQEVLPGANCGGCGYPGCAGFAGACVKADSLDGLLCPVGGGPVMAKVATILGKEAGTAEPMVACPLQRNLLRPAHVQTLMMERKVAPSPLPFTEARRIVLFGCPGLWRLRERLRFRCDPHQSRLRNRRGGRGKCTSAALA